MSRHSERWFKIGTGLFAAAVVVLVAGMAVELTRQSWLAIEKFGLTFWMTDIWDPVSGEFGARPFIWGTLLFVGARVDPRCAGGARDRDLPDRALPAAGCARRSRSSPSCSRPFRRSSTGCGASSCWCRPSGPLQVAFPDALRQLPLFFGSAARRGHAVGGPHPRRHGGAVHLLGCARGAARGAGGAA